jgi:hypothetical protein
MNWEGVIKAHGNVQSVYGQEQLVQNPFLVLGWEAKLHRENNGIPMSRVSCTVQRAVAYGDIKVSFTVSMECPQSEPFIDLAGHVVYEKAKELTDDAFCGIVEGAVRLPSTT